MNRTFTGLRRAGSALALGLALVATPPASAAEEVASLDARVALDAFRATVEAHLAGVSLTTRTLAATEEARSTQWERIAGPLGAFAENCPEDAAVWFALPDGTYWSVQKGLSEASLKDRDYFPDLLAGREVVGSLVVSKSTGKRAVIVASPVRVDGTVVGAIGVSLDAVRLAGEIDRAIGFPPNVVFYALDAQGRTAVHRAGELIFEFPSEVGNDTLKGAVETMLSDKEGVVHYEFGGNAKTAVFTHSTINGWVYVLGIAAVPENGAAD